MAAPPHDCRICPRLAAFRAEQRTAHADWFNAPVPAFGDRAAWLAIVGLAPGLHGANRTGRPFTGDGSGELLYRTLIDCGLAAGEYGGHAADGLALHGVTIVNAVACVPPRNRPTPAEIAACRPFLADALAALPALRVVVALGRIAHDSTIRAYGGVPARRPFAHRAEHALTAEVVLIDSYHCSRYNQNTGRLTAAMLAAVFARAAAFPPRP